MMMAIKIIVAWTIIRGRLRLEEINWRSQSGWSSNSLLHRMWLVINTYKEELLFLQLAVRQRATTAWRRLIWGYWALWLKKGMRVIKRKLLSKALWKSNKKITVQVSLAWIAWNTLKGCLQDVSNWKETITQLVERSSTKGNRHCTWKGKVTKDSTAVPSFPCHLTCQRRHSPPSILMTFNNLRRRLP
jgi:hypothetical protein